MELRQLRYFVAVAEERSFTRAAARLHISQQSLSAAIRRLEVQLGFALFDRTTQRVEPTAAGEALLVAAPTVTTAMGEAIDAARRAAGVVRGELRMRYGLDSETFVEPLLAAFQEAHPALAVRAWTGMDADNLAALRSGDLDAVFAWAEVPSDLVGERVAEEQVLLAIPDRDGLAHLNAIPRAIVAGRRLVMFPREGAPAVWDLLVLELRSGVMGDAAIRQLPASGQATMADAVLRGDGLCPVSESLASRLLRPGLVLRPLDPPIHVPLFLVWKGTPAEALRKLAAGAAGGAHQASC